MALVSNGYKLSVTLVDNGANRSTLSYRLVAADEAAATAATATIIGHLQTLSVASIQSYTLGLTFVEDALTLPGLGVHVEDQALVVLQLNGDPTKRTTIRIPAPTAAMFVGASGPSADEVDVTHVPLQDYAGIYNVTGGIASISDGEFTVDNPRAGVVSGKRIKRGTSRG